MSYVSMTKAKILELLGKKADLDPVTGLVPAAQLPDFATNNDLDSHVEDTSNPHEVTKAQVGLGDADNTPDMGKPVSVAQQAALDSKATIQDTDYTAMIS